MMLKRTVSIILSVLICMLSVCGCKEGKKRYTKTFIDYFDTAATLIGYETKADVFSKNAEKVEQLINKYNRLFDIYNTYDGVNNLCTVNQNAGMGPVKVDKEIIELLNISEAYYNKTDKAVNIAFGSVLSIWHKYRTEGLDNPKLARLPKTSELAAAAKYTDFSNIVIDESQSTVFIKEKNASLDVGAVAKGFTVDKIGELLVSLGCEGYAINFGGTVKAVGEKPDKKDWTVAIENPKDTAKSILNVTTGGLSVITSGTYRRYYTVNGVDYHHIIDTKTLFPENRYASVTVITKNATDGDLLSTALFNLDIQKGKEVVSDLDDTYILWVYADGKYEYSDGFEKFIIK